MSMVELLNSDEFAKVERCLRDAVDCAAQRVGAGSGQRSGAWTDNEIFTMRNRLLQMQENVLHKLGLGVDCSGLSEHAVNRNGELVLFSGHAYDRRCEEEIARLESEANALASELGNPVRVRPRALSMATSGLGPKMRRISVFSNL